MRVPPGTQLILNQTVFSTTPNTTGASVYSDPMYSDWLGKPNDLKLFVVVDRATASGTLLVTVEETSDEQLPIWFSWYTESVTGAGNFSAPGETVMQVVDSVGTRGGPSLAYRRVNVQVFGATAVSSRVRVWAAGRNGYRRFHRLLMAERVEGPSPFYAQDQACASLIGTDNLTFGYWTDEVVGGSPTLSVLLGESPNGRTWADQISTPRTIASGVPYLTVIPDLLPWSGFLRVGLQIGGTGNPAAAVRLWVTGRDVRSG